MRLESTATLPEVVLIEPAVFADERGWFMESFNAARCDAALQAAGLPPAPPFVQDNHSCSQAGVLRGLHYQLPPHAQGKLVRVVQGAAWDVAVDIRRGSPTFGRWAGAELTADNRRQLWIPPGFAHGFVALVDDTHFLYKTTDVYAKDCERSIRWDDPAIAHRLAAARRPRAAPGAQGRRCAPAGRGRGLQRLRVRRRGRCRGTRCPASSAAPAPRGCGRRRPPAASACALICSKSGVRNSFHSVTSSSASAPSSASAALSTKLEPGHAVQHAPGLVHRHRVVGAHAWRRAAAVRRRSRGWAPRACRRCWA